MFLFKADYKFVTQELAIALTPAYNSQTRARAGAMAIGLGIAALPKTGYTFTKYLVQSAIQAARSVNSINSPIDPTVFGH